MNFKRVNVIPDERGRLVEILRNDDPMFKQFGQVYITTAYPGVTKAWHLHREQTDHIMCIRGMVKWVTIDPKNINHPVEEFFIGEHNPLIIEVPPGVWHGYKNIGIEECMVLNIPDKVYKYSNPDEIRRDISLPIILDNKEEQLYSWGREDK